jgi:hypothetical protein
MLLENAFLFDGINARAKETRFDDSLPILYYLMLPASNEGKQFSRLESFIPFGRHFSAGRKPVRHHTLIN